MTVEQFLAMLQLNDVRLCIPGAAAHQVSDQPSGSESNHHDPF